ncbi:hypothetical protein AAMO2058_001183000 [Amorphochlora amoebiformis]
MKCTENLMKCTVGKELKELSHPISHLSFSPCGQYLATGDLGRYVALFRWYHRDERKNKPIEWTFVGRYKSHRKPIVSVKFLPGEWQADKSNVLARSLGAVSDIQIVYSRARLFSVGEDALMHEYDVVGSSIRRGVRLRSTTKIDEFGIPTGFFPIGGKEPALACANNEFKLKLRRFIVTKKDLKKSKKGGVGGSKSKKAVNPSCHCIRTTVAPTYGGPPCKFEILPKLDTDGKGSISDSDFIIFSTYEKIIGMMKAPLDGNPMKTAALLAHAGEISSFACTCDGKFVLTAGGPDGSVFAWGVSTAALDSSIILGGDPNKAYLGMLEGGESGEEAKSIMDYFYLSQLKVQGLRTTEARKITGRIPGPQVVNVFRAMGFFPSESEIDDLTQEMAQTASIPKDDNDVAQVDFNDLVRLYVNHRPVFGLKREDIRLALRKIMNNQESGKRDDLIDFLVQNGNKISRKDLTRYLIILRGADKNSTLPELLDELPEVLSVDDVAEDLLGFTLRDPEGMPLKSMVFPRLRLSVAAVAAAGSVGVLHTANSEKQSFDVFTRNKQSFKVERGLIREIHTNWYPANNPIEDTNTFRLQLKQESGSLFGVFDGHSGGSASAFCRDDLFDILEYKSKESKSAILSPSAFTEADEIFLQTALLVKLPKFNLRYL